MGTNLCEKCVALCCRYVALPIDNPTDVTDYDNQIDSNVAGSDLEGTVVGGGSINVKIR